MNEVKEICTSLVTENMEHRTLLQKDIVDHHISMSNFILSLTKNYKGEANLLDIIE